MKKKINKNMILVIFFLLLEIMKKNIFIMKNENKIVQIWNGLLPNCILREWELYCNIGFCIAVRNLGWAKIVLQYTGLYCSDGGRIVSQYTAVYCSRKAGNREDCVAIQFTVL